MLSVCRGRQRPGRMPGAGEVPVAMRLREIPVPIPNTMVKTQAADGTTPWGVGEQVAAGAPSKKGLEPKERQDSGAQEGASRSAGMGLQEGEWSEPTRAHRRQEPPAVP